METLLFLLELIVGGWITVTWMQRGIFSVCHIITGIHEPSNDRKNKSIVSKDEAYARNTGIQPLFINTLFQLMAEKEQEQACLKQSDPFALP